MLLVTRLTDPSDRLSTKEVEIPPTLPAPESLDECKLRIIFVNDVYELDNLPRFATCVREQSTANTVVLLPGDFVAPSLLSQLDYARGMVDCLNRCGVHYVCFGNHEADIPHAGRALRLPRRRRRRRRRLGSSSRRHTRLARAQSLRRAGAAAAWAESA